MTNWPQKVLASATDWTYDVIILFQGGSCSGIADSLGINEGNLHRWRRKYTPAGEITQQAQQQSEIGRLQHRIAELEEENDILKKASAYFAKNLKA